MFSKELLKYWIEMIEHFVPFMKGSIDEFMEKQKAQFHRHSGEVVASQVKEPLTFLIHSSVQKGVLAILWDLLLLFMLLYFLVSIVNSSVQSYLLERDEEEVAKLKESKKEK